MQKRTIRLFGFLFVAAILVFVFFFMFPLKESLTNEIGRYDYLKPTALVYDENGQLPNRWSDETHVKVNDFFKIDNTESLRDSKPFNPNSFFATEEEAFYLLEYGHWPINGYVEEKLREGKVEIPFLYPSDEESIKKYMNGLIYPNRFLYQRFIQPVESNEDLAYRIWYGITEPPTENTSSKMTVKKYTYDFLKPIETMNSDGTTTVNKWHPETMERVMQQLQINKVEMPTYDPSMLVHWFPYATETEAVFYINKGFWPINTYVKEKMKTMTLLDMRKGPNNITKEDIIKGIFPNRLVYALYIQQRESEEEPPRSYAYNVFMGTKKPPESGCAV
jgi:hypothetical protein